MYGLAWPRWLSPLTVGPHTYMPTCPGVIDLKTSFCLEYELYIFSSLMILFAIPIKPGEAISSIFLWSAFVLLSSSVVANLLLRHANCSLVLYQIYSTFSAHGWHRYYGSKRLPAFRQGFYFASQNIDNKTSVFICSIRIICVLFAQQRTVRWRVRRNESLIVIKKPG